MTQSRIARPGSSRYDTRARLEIEVGKLAYTGRLTASEICTELGIRRSTVIEICDQMDIHIQPAPPVRQQCGTANGRTLHRRHKEPICDSCAAHHSAVHRAAHALLRESR